MDVFNSVKIISPESIASPRWRAKSYACDSHLHIFGNLEKYPASPNARYTRPDADLSQAVRVARALGIERLVLVQPSFYGTDNSYILDTLAQMRGGLRAVLISNGARDCYEEWHNLGVRGIRLDLFKAQADGMSIRGIQELVLRSCSQVESLGWSVDLYVPGSISWQLAPIFKDASAPISIGHMGYLTERDGVSWLQCENFIQASAQANVWLKLTGLYRYGSGAEYRRAKSLVKAIASALPDRILWGSDWPHVMAPAQDSGSLLNDVLNTLGSEALNEKMLVTNPGELYGFNPGESLELMSV